MPSEMGREVKLISPWVALCVYNDGRARRGHGPGDLKFKNDE